jgi:superfamily II DNA or RNA helicase
MTHFYSHIDDAIGAMNQNTSGAETAPTGVGKGEIICRHLFEKFTATISKSKKKKKIRIAIIVTHRIMLSQQLMQRAVEYFLKEKVQPSFTRISVHSGSAVEFNDLDTAEEKMWVRQYGDIKASSNESLREELEKCINLGKDVTISTTYHSLAKTRKVLNELGIKATVSYLDEIHRGVANVEWYKELQQFIKQCDTYYGFTATPGSHRGKIVNLLGAVIWHMDINTAITRGLICKPRWMVVEVEGNKDHNLAQGIAKAFIKFEEKTNIKCKMLVHSFSSLEIATIADSKHVKSLYNEYPDLMIAEISSERGPRIDGVELEGSSARQTWLDSVKKHKGRLIVLHIDICNSGIDVPGFNFPLWTYYSESETYTIQGNGRGGRLELGDRTRLECGEITTQDLSNWNKPYNTVGLLVFENSMKEDTDSFVKFVLDSREQGFDPTDIVYSGLGSSTKKPDPFELGGSKKGFRQSSAEVAVTVALENEQLRELIADYDENDPMADFDKFD